LTNNEKNLSQSSIKKTLDHGIGCSVLYTLSKSRFYQEKLAQATFSISDICRSIEAGSSGLEVLSQLPTTCKDELNRAGKKTWCVPQSDIVDISTTSGTTGIATLYPMTQKDITRLGYNEKLCFETAGITRDDIVILAVTQDRCIMAGLAYFEGLKQIGATVIRTGSASVLMVLEMIKRIKPTAIVAVPSFLSRVADQAHQSGLSLNNSSVSKLICIGEPIRDKTFELTNLGKYLSEQWSAELYSTYGQTEIATAFCECRYGLGGHFHPELIYVEVLDDEGNKVPDGKIGELTATTIGVEAMPVLRFRTGDYSFINRKRCDCGLETWRVGPILGRKKQMLKLKGTTVYPMAVQQVLESIEHITGYVMTARNNELLSDELEILISVKNSFDGNMKDIVLKHCQAQLKVKPHVRVVDLKKIEELQRDGKNRKRRVFIDERK